MTEYKNRLPKEDRVTDKNLFKYAPDLSPGERAELNAKRIKNIDMRVARHAQIYGEVLDLMANRPGFQAASLIDILLKLGLITLDDFDDAYFVVVDEALAARERELATQSIMKPKKGLVIPMNKGADKC